MAGLPFDVQGARAAGYSDDQIVNELQQSGKVPFDFAGAMKAGHSSTDILSEVAPQPSSTWDNFKQGAADMLEGLGNTGKQYLGYGDGLVSAGKAIEPANFVPSPIIDKNGFHASGILPSMARGAAPLAGGVLAAGLAAPAAASLGLPTAAALAAPAALGWAENAGNEAEATGSKTKGALIAAAEAAPQALPISKFLPGSSALEAAGAGGIKAAGGNALSAMARGAVGGGLSAAAGEVTRGALSDTAGQFLRNGNIDPIEVANAAATGAVTPLPFVAPRVMRAVLNAHTYSDITGSPEMLDAAKMAANRVQSAAGDDNIQGRLFFNGKIQRAGAEAFNKARTANANELSDAVSKIKTQLPVDAQNVLKAAQSGLVPNERGYSVLQAGLGNDPQAANVLNLVRQSHVFNSVGETGHMINGKFTGGLGGSFHNILSGEHIAKSAMVGIGAAALEDGAGHLIAYSPAALGMAGVGAGLGRFFDNLTGAQAPAGRFVRNFADGTDTQRVNVPQPTTPVTPSGPTVGPTGPRIAPLASPWTQGPTTQGPVQPPVAGGSALTPQIQAQMAVRATLARLAQANQPPPVAPAPQPKPLTEAQALRSQIKEATDLMAARKANARLLAAQQKPAAPAPAPAVPTAVPATVASPAPAPMSSTDVAYAQGLHYGRAQPGTVENPKFLKIEAATRGLDPDAFSRGVSDGASGGAAADDLSIPPFLRRTPETVSKANGKTQINEEPFAASSYAHLPVDQAGDAILKDAQIGKGIKFAVDYRKGIVSRLTKERQAMASIGAEVPGLPLAELTARLEGRSSQADAKAFREHVRGKFPQTSAALDKYLSDAAIKEFWRKKGA